MPFTLLHPGLFAFGIACVAIPIILHLLKRKRRPIPWGAMRFLEQAYRKRRRILTIEQLILLALRCLLLSLIAMGVGSLMLGSGIGQTLPTTMVVVIDQSIGSALVDGGSTSLAQNKAFALRALDELDSVRGDRVMLIGAGMPTAGMVMPESSDIGAVRSMIEAIEATDSKIDLASALALAGNMSTDPDRQTRSVLVVAASGRGLDRSQTESGNQVGFDRVLVMSPTTKARENIGIANASATRSLVTHSGLSLPMGVRVGLVRSGMDNESEQTSTVRVLDMQGETIGQREVRWSNGQSEMSAAVAIDTASIKSMGARTAMIEVRVDDDANSRDNRWMIPLATRSVIRVGVIDRAMSGALGRAGQESGMIAPSRWVRSALAPSDEFGISIVDIEASRASTMLAANLDAVVVLAPSALDDAAWDRLSQLNETGMLVVLTQDARTGSIEWLDRVDAFAPGLIGSTSVLRDHDQPAVLAPNQSFDESSLLFGIASEFDQLARAVSVSRSVRLSTNTDDGAMMVLEDGSALAVQSMPSDGRGMVVVFGCAFDLDWTNLPARAMFVAVMQEIVRQGVGVGSSMPVIEAGERIAKAAWVVSSHRAAIGNISNLNAPNIMQDSAHAGVIAQLDSQGVTRGYVVINPDAEGADTNPTSVEVFEKAILSSVDVEAIDWIQVNELATGGDADETNGLMSESASPGVSISLWMLMGAGLVAVIEFVLARLFTAKLFEAQGIDSRGARA